MKEKEEEEEEKKKKEAGRRKRRKKEATMVTDLKHLPLEADLRPHGRLSSITMSHASQF